MSENGVIRVRNTLMLDWAVYLTLAVFTSMGFIFLDNPIEQGIVVISLVAFGLAHYLGYRRARTSTHFHIYFGIQILIVIWLLLEFPAADLFSFLFFILGIQVMLALPTRIAVRWVLLFFLIESASLLIRQGFDGIIAVLFNIPVYFLVSVFAYT